MYYLQQTIWQLNWHTVNCIVYLSELLVVVTDQLKLVRIRDRNVPRIHEHKLLDDEASLASLSLQERDGIGWLMLRGAILLKHK